jgi:Zn-dependent membrane protease YugP
MHLDRAPATRRRLPAQELGPWERVVNVMGRISTIIIIIIVVVVVVLFLLIIVITIIVIIVFIIITSPPSFSSSSSSSPHAPKYRTQKSADTSGSEEG